MVGERGNGVDEGGFLRERAKEGMNQLSEN